MVHNFFPWNSPIEETFKDRLFCFLSFEVELRPQFEVQTQCGNYWLDFAIFHGIKIIGIECDGKEYHEREYDFWRDSLILGTKKIQDIIRITGHQIHLYINSCLFQLGRWYPWLFSSGDLAALEKMSKNEFVEQEDYIDELEKKYEKISEDNENFEPHPLYVHHEFDDILQERFLTRRTTDTLYWVGRTEVEDFRIRWRDCYEYAINHGGRDLKTLISDYRKEFLK